MLLWHLLDLWFLLRDRLLDDGFLLRDWLLLWDRLLLLNLQTFDWFLENRRLSISQWLVRTLTWSRWCFTIFN